MLGVGVAEGTGLIGTALRRLVLKTPKSLVTMVVVFAGVMSSIASDAGYVVLVPLGAVIFMSCGRHPLAGIVSKHLQGYQVDLVQIFSQDLLMLY